MIFNQVLSGEFRLQGIMTRRDGDQEPALHDCALIAEDLLQDLVRDERFEQTVAVKGDSAPIKLRRSQGNGRNKNSQNAFHGVRGTAPDAEESEDVVDAKGVEVGTHLRETLLPPGETIL